MNRNYVFASATAFACSLVFAALPSFAAATDYRFELVDKPQPADGKDVVKIQIVHTTDGKPVPDAVIFKTTVDMGPAGMPTMPAVVKALPAKDGVYSFEIVPGMTGTWAVHLAAKVQGETETIRGTVNADLVK